MKIFIEQINVFANTLRAGNPATVCLLNTDFLPTDAMQSIASNSGTTETIFLLPCSKGGSAHYKVRFFTSTQEIDMCGHGAIAAAHCLWRNNYLNCDPVTLMNMNAKIITISRVNQNYCLTLLRIPFIEATPPCCLQQDFLGLYDTFYRAVSRAWILSYKSAVDIVSLDYRPAALINSDERAIIVTAPHYEKNDNKNGYVLRYFTPAEKITEDHATGIAQAMIAPLWANFWQSNSLMVQQLSTRGGMMQVTVHPHTIDIVGQAITYFSSHMYLP